MWTRTELSEAQKLAPEFCALMARWGYRFESDFVDTFVADYGAGSGYGECVIVTCYASDDSEEESDARTWADKDRRYLVWVGARDLDQPVARRSWCQNLAELEKELASTAAELGMASAQR